MKKNIRIRKFCIIFDERAEGDAALQEGVDRFRKLGHSVLQNKIDKPIDAVRLASEAVGKGVDTVVAVGGDGMFHLVVNGILRRGDAACAVGLVPFGTGNDFAGASGIPLDDSLGALDLLIRVKPVRIDVGSVNGTFFVNVVTGGFPAQAAAGTSGLSKELLGGFAYLLAGVVNLGNLKAKKVRFAGPGFKWKGKSYAFSLGNGRSAGGGFKVSPRAQVNDGLLDLMIAPESEDGVLPLIAEFSRVSNLGKPEKLIYVQVPELELESHEILHLNLDGEPVEGRKFRFKAHPRRLQAYLPPNSPVLHPPSPEIEV